MRKQPWTEKVSEWLEEFVWESRVFYIFLFVAGVFPAVVTSALAASGICSGTYEYCDSARFHDVMLWLMLVFDFAVDVFVSAVRRYRGRAYMLVLKAMHIVGCVVAYGMSAYVNLAFLAVARIRDWAFVISPKRRSPISETVVRSLYMTGLFSIILLLLILLFSLIGFNIFWNTDEYESPFGTLGHSLVVVMVYVTGGRWMEFQNQLDIMGYHASKALSIVFVGLGVLLFTNVYVAIVCNSWLAEAQRGASHESKKTSGSTNATGNKDGIQSDQLHSFQSLLEDSWQLYIQQARHMRDLYKELLVRGLMASNLVDVGRLLREYKLHDCDFNINDKPVDN